MSSGDTQVLPHAGADLPISIEEGRSSQMTNNPRAEQRNHTADSIDIFGGEKDERSGSGMEHESTDFRIVKTLEVVLKKNLEATNEEDNSPDDKKKQDGAQTA